MYHLRNLVVDQIRESGVSLPLLRRYHRLTGKTINKFRLMSHIARMRRTKRFAYWQKVGSQAIQDVVERLDKAYQRFFAYRRGELGLKTARPASRR